MLGKDEETMERCLLEGGNIGSIDRSTINGFILHKSPTHYDAHLAMLKNNLNEYLRELLQRIYSLERIAIFLIDTEMFG